MTRVELSSGPAGVALLLALLLALSGCGHHGATGSAAVGSVTTSATASPVTAASPVPAASPAPATSAVPALPAVTAPAAPSATTPPLPASLPTGGCHGRGSGLYVLPDPSCTPGATNAAVTPTDIGQTICRSGWTASVRPPESYTEPLKYQQMQAYGESGSASGYEEDHLIPLELGGSPSSPANLWPEPGASPNPKDSVENAANQAVCTGKMALAVAQKAIAEDWITLGQQLGVAQQAPTSPGSSGPAGTCTASASFDSSYGDWDIYVHSDQPDQTVQVTASGGATAGYRTDGSGYADVYLHAPVTATGQSVTVTVGRATCETAL